MRRLSALFLGIVLVAPMGWGGELAGVDLPDQVSVNGKNLKLNGMGLRKKSIIKVYVAGLYLEEGSQDSATIVDSAAAKHIIMHFLTGKATKKKMDTAWLEGFEANSPSEFDSLAERVNAFADLFGDMEKGDRITLTVVPGSPTIATLNGQKRGTIDGDDFGRALLLVWLGDHPPSEDLKTGMLGS